MKKGFLNRAVSSLAAALNGIIGKDKFSKLEKSQESFIDKAARAEATAPASSNVRLVLTNSTSAIQSTGKGAAKRYFRVLVRNRKGCGIRCCDEDGHFIPRKQAKATPQPA